MDGVILISSEKCDNLKLIEVLFIYIFYLENAHKKCDRRGDYNPLLFLGQLLKSSNVHTLGVIISYQSVHNTTNHQTQNGKRT